MKYVFDIDEYIIIENKEDEDKIEKNKVEGFFKKNWKIIISTFGITMTGLIAYFVYKIKHIHRSIEPLYDPSIVLSNITTKNNNYTSSIKQSIHNTQDSITPKITNIEPTPSKENPITMNNDKKINTFNLDPNNKNNKENILAIEQNRKKEMELNLDKKIESNLSKLPNEIKKDLKSKNYNVTTANFIVDRLIDLSIPEIQKEIETSAPDIVVDIINNSNNKEQMLSKLYLAYENKEIDFTDIPQSIKKAFSKYQIAQRAILSSDQWERRIQDLEKFNILNSHNDIDNNKLPDHGPLKLIKAQLKHPDDNIYQEALRRLQNIIKIQGKYWKDQQLRKDARESTLKKYNLSTEKIGAQTYNWLINPKTGPTKDDFFKYLDDNYHVFNNNLNPTVTINKSIPSTDFNTNVNFMSWEDKIKIFNSKHIRTSAFTKTELAMISQYSKKDFENWLDHYLATIDIKITKSVLRSAENAEKERVKHKIIK